MKAEKDFVNTMIGMIFIVLIGVAFFTLFNKEITQIATDVFTKINEQFSSIKPGAGFILPLLK